MGRVTCALAICFGSCISAPASAEVVPELGVSARYLYHHETDHEHGELTLRPSIEVVGERTLLRVSGRLRTLSSELLDLKPPVVRFYDPASRPRAVGKDTVAELREAYLSWWSRDWQLSLGRQLVNWGKLDGYKVLDAVNPQDFREYILEDFDESRIGTWGIRIERAGPRWGWQFLWSPDRTTHDLADPGTAFELSAPRFQPDANLSLPTAITRLAPDRDLFAMQISRTSTNTDWRLVFIDGFEYEPLARLRSGDIVLLHPKRRMVGGNVERATGPIVLRAEAAYRFDRQLARQAGVIGDAAVVDQVTAGVGIDYAAPGSWHVGFQLIRDHIPDAPSDLTRSATDSLSTLNVRRTFLNDKLGVDLRWYSSFDDKDGLVRLKLSYDSDTAGKVTVGADHFYGTSDGLFGQFDAQERVYVMWEQTF